MTSPTVVLVHGAFADASSWSGVIAELQAAGVNVTAPPNQLRGIPTDAAYLTSFVNQLGGPTILVGHSYGGALITQSGTDARDVVGLVFVAAFAPEADEKLADINARYPDIPLSAAQRTFTYPTGDGNSGTEVFIDHASFHDAFCADVPVERARVMALTQRPVAVDAFTSVVTGTPHGTRCRRGRSLRPPTTQSIPTPSATWPSVQAPRLSNSTPRMPWPSPNRAGLPR